MSDYAAMASIGEALTLSKQNPKDNPKLDMSDPYKSLHDFCELLEQPDRAPDVNPDSCTPRLILWFEQCLERGDAAHDRALEWLREQFGCTRIDCFTYELLERLLPYVRDNIVSKLSELNRTLHADVGILFLIKLLVILMSFFM